MNFIGSEANIQISFDTILNLCLKSHKINHTLPKISKHLNNNTGLSGNINAGNQFCATLVNNTCTIPEV